jgi:hypothetical protein
MPAPEYRNMPTEEVPELEKESHTRDIPGDRHASSVDRPAMLEAQHEESPLEILERFTKQDFEIGHDVRLPQHLKSAESDTNHPKELIEKEKLEEILDDARGKRIPHSLLESLWDLRSCHPEDVEEPPMVREHALSDVIRPMWEQGLDHELKNDLLFDLEGEEAMEKLYVPQPEVEIENPQNLYQLVRKACDQNRMAELLTMIEENDDALLGETLEQAIARHKGISL